MFERLKRNDVLYYLDGKGNVKSTKVVSVDRERDSFLTENCTCYKSELGRSLMFSKESAELKSQMLNEIIELYAKTREENLKDAYYEVKQRIMEIEQLELTL